MTDTTALADPTDCAPSTAHPIDPDAASTVAGALKALSDPLRLRMLSAIATDSRGESCVCDLADLASVSQPTISHHLKVLKDTGLVDSERRGTWVWYRIAPTRRRAVSALLDTFAPAATGGAAPDVQPDGALRDLSLDDLDSSVSRLASDLADRHPDLSRDLVTALVRESYTGLARSAKLTRHLIPLTERFAQQRLSDLQRDRSSAAPQVLFVCVQNAGRSQIAAALVNALSGGAVVARSAGSMPSAEVHPNVQRLLADIDGEGTIRDEYPKPLTDDAVRAADVVVTMGCGDVCPIVPGVRYEDWAVGDPAVASPDALTAIRNDIEAHVRDLLAALNPDNT